VAAEKKGVLDSEKNVALQERPARQHRAPPMRNPNTLPLLSPKKKTTNMDARRKTEDFTHQRVEPEVQRAGLERGGGGGGGEGALRVNGWSEHTKYIAEIRGAGVR
jgi:hypothetical protein